MRLPNGYGSVYKLSGKRRKPFVVKKTIGYHVDQDAGKSVRDDLIIGYAATKAEGLKMLADYNSNPYDLKVSNLTFEGLYEEWSEREFKSASNATISAHKAAFGACAPLHNKLFIDINSGDLQYLFDTTDKNYPTMRKMKNLISLMYKYAMKYDYVTKDYSQYIVRGYYEGDEALEGYFRAMMWYGRISFLAEDEDATRSALLMTAAIGDGEKEAWEAAFSCYLLSLQYERESKQAASELYYISQKADHFTEPSFADVQKYAKEYGIPLGPDKDVVGLAYAYGNRFLNDHRYDVAVYFFTIVYDLTHDDEIKKIIEDIQKKRN